MNPSTYGQAPKTSGVVPSKPVTSTIPKQSGASIGAGANNVQVKKLEGQIQELRLQNDTLDKERDFYFTKLRDIEMLLQARSVESEGDGLGPDILKILYASEDEKVTVAGDGILTITGPTTEAAPVGEADAVME